MGKPRPGEQRHLLRVNVQNPSPGLLLLSSLRREGPSSAPPSTGLAISSAPSFLQSAFIIHDGRVILLASSGPQGSRAPPCSQARGETGLPRRGCSVVTGTLGSSAGDDALGRRRLLAEGSDPGLAVSERTLCANNCSPAWAGL